MYRLPLGLVKARAYSEREQRLFKRLPPAHAACLSSKLRRKRDDDFLALVCRAFLVDLMVLSLLLQNMQKAGSPRTEIMQRLRCGKNYQKVNIERQENQKRTVRQRWPASKSWWWWMTFWPFCIILWHGRDWMISYILWSNQNTKNTRTVKQ